MDMFLIFVVIFLSVVLGIALAAALLSLFFRVIRRLADSRSARASMAPAPASSQAPPN
jgi:phosphate/sulfate permease